MYQSQRYKQILRDGLWHVFVGPKNDIGPAELDMQIGDADDVYLVPALEGRGVGAALVVAGSLLTAAAPVIAGASFAGALWVGIGAAVVGVAATMYGVHEMIHNMVPDTPDQTVRPDKNASFVFKGPINTRAQGVPIPIGYGKALVGSVTISAGVYAEEMTVNV